MGLTKEYSRFSASGDSFGLIASPDSCVRFLSINNVHDKFIATSGCQHINIWDFKTHHLVGTLGSSTSKITCFEVVSTTDPLIAVGHADGSIVVYDYVSRELKCTLNGHKNAVTCLAFDPDRMRLVSGGKDTTLVVWDLVNESGLFKLKGHKNVITQCRFMKHYNYLISSSKDGFMKFWDLDSQHCFKTFVAHRNQILDFVLFRNDTRLITGSDELKVWKISQKSDKDKNQDLEEQKENQANDNSDADEGEDEDKEDETCIFSVKSYGSILRESTSNFRGFTLDPNERILLCRGKDSTLECFKLRTREEVKERLQKKARKQRKHLRKLQADQQDDQNQEMKVNLTLTLSDEIERMKALQAGHKIRFCDISSHKNFSKVAILLLNNSVELFSMNLIDFTASKLTSLETEGHRSNVRTVAFSSDNLHIVSTSDESLKIWNRKTRCCVTTISESYEPAMCSTFVQSDRFVVTGTKTGKLQIFDLGEASITQTIEASEQSLAIRSLCLDPDGKGLVTGSEDKNVKFWEFQFVKQKNNKKLTLTLAETRTLDLSEEVLCVKISPNGKFIAVSLLDSSVKIFYVDTLRFFLTLYGHKLPILAMDISHDSRLIATGSSDKNLKLWGLDFGDCHKSIFAHDLAITSVNFIPRTHHLFTSSNDKTIKLWDADNFEKIIALKGHQGEVLCTAVSPNGKHLVSASHDKTLRLWEETDEPLILEEEREMEREEEMFNENDLFDNHVIPGESNQETTLATKSTKESVIATERLIEAIEIFNTSSKTLIAHRKLCDLAKEQGKKAPPAPTLHPLMVAYNTDCPHRFMLKTLMKIKASEIQEALISLPFNNVIDMLKILCEIIERQWEREAMTRIACFLIRTHFGQISSTPNLLPAIDKLRQTMKPAITELKDLFGFNLSSLEYFQSELEARNEVKFFLDLYEKREKSKKNKKKARKVVENAPILSLK